MAIGNHTATYKTTQEIFTTGQQHIQPTIYQGSNQVDACILWVSCQAHVAQGSQAQKLHWMVAAHRKDITPRQQKSMLVKKTSPCSHLLATLKKSTIDGNQ
jgi:hypothetical protein